MNVVPACGDDVVCLPITPYLHMFMQNLWPSRDNSHTFSQALLKKQAK